MSTLARATTWSLGLWHLASGRVRADRAFLFGVWLLLTCATTLLASGILYGDAVAVGSLRAAIRAAPAADQGVVVESDLTAAQASSVDPAVQSDLRAGLGRPGGDVTLQARSGSLVPTGTPLATAGQHLTVLESASNVEAHAVLAAGRWARSGRDPIEAAVSEGAAQALGLMVGDRVPLADAATPGADPDRAVVTVVVVGIYRPAPADPYWAGDPLDLAGVAARGGSTYRGPFLVSQADLLAPGRFGRLDVRWRALPALDRLTADDIERLRGRMDVLPDLVRGVFPVEDATNVSTGLGDVLDTVGRSLQVARAAVLLLTLQFAVVAGYAILLVAGMLADRRRAEVGLLRSRGASTAHVVALAFGEAILLAIPAAVLAPWLAEGIVRLLGQVGPLAATGAIAEAGVGVTTVVAAAITGLVAAIVLTMPALASGVEVAGIRAVLGRPVARTLAQRLGIDVALGVVAGLAIWQLRTYGAPITRNARGALGLDPLLVAAPAFGLMAGAVLATRLVPRLAEIGERVLARGSGLVPPLGARQVARRPLRYTRAALLLMLATALGTFGGAYAATWTASQADQAAYQAGADVRVTPGSNPSLPGWSLGPAYRSLPGVTGAMPVVERDVSVGQVVRDGQLVALDAKTARSIALLPPGPEARSLPAALAALAAARPALAAIRIPDSAQRLGVVLDANVDGGAGGGQGAAAPEAPAVPSGYRGITVSAVVRDADGRLLRLEAATGALPALFVGERQSIDVPLPTADGLAAGAGPARPLWLVAIELQLESPFGLSMAGTLEVRSVSTSPSAGANGWTALPLDASSAGWSWDQAYAAGFTPLEASSGRVSLLPGSGAGITTVRFRAAMPADAPIPVIASDRFLVLTGSHVGQTVAGRIDGSSRTMRVLAQGTEFPTLDPARPFVVVDGPTLDLAQYAASGATEAPADWWLSTTASGASGVAARLAAGPFRSQAVVSRMALLGTLAVDPVGLGTLGALVLGSLAATAFAALGFLVGAAVSTRERRGEFAILRALGLSTRQLATWLSVEHAFLLGLGLVAGTGVGLLLAWLVLPATLLGATGMPVVPVPVIEIPWALLGVAYLAAGGLLALAVGIVAHPLPGVGIARALRGVEE